MKRFLFPLAAISLIGASAIPAGATNSWGDYHWSRSSNPANLVLVDSTTWDSYLDASQADWEVSTVLAFQQEQGNESTQQRKKCSAILGKIRVCNQKYGFNGWLGIAQVWLYSGTKHIAQSTVKLNDSYFGLAAYNNVNEKLHVMCQEIGHGFGLGHQSEDGSSQNSCMDYYHNENDADTQSTRPNAHDYEMLEAMYSHFDGSSRASTSSSGSSGSDHHHHHSYVTRQGRYTVITDITYAG